MVELLTRDQIAERRGELLQQVRMTEEELRRRAEEYSLTPEEDAVLSEIESLDFLLAG